MSKFAPSVEAARLALGARIPIESKPHPAGVAGIALSLDEVALRTRRGRNDPRVRSWAIRAIHRAGGPQNFRGQAEAILASFRETATYVQDPLGTEFVQAAHETLCLDDKGLCFMGGDCFAAGTKVLRRDGAWIRIEAVQLGDVIWGRDTWTRVVEWVVKGPLTVDSILMSSGSMMHLTPNHHVFVVVDGRTSRIRVHDLQPGDRLLQPLMRPFTDRVWDAPATVRSIERASAIVECFDIQTEDHYVYLPEHDVTVSNCDDVTVAVAAACLSVGIPTKIVGQSFKEGNPPTHVLLAIQADKDTPLDWLRIDPSTNKPVGDYVFAVKEWWIDPMDINDPTTKNLAGTTGGDFVGVGAIGLGDAVSPSIIQGVTDQVTSGLYSLETSVNSLATSLAMIAQVTAITGFDPEPTIPIVSVAQFQPSGLWTAAMDKIARDFLSQGDFMVSVGHDALNGTRIIYMDTQNVLSIGKLPADTYTWQAVAANADIILAIFNPAGALLGGIATTIGQWLTPAQVQAAVPTGTVQGLGAIQLLPVVVGVAVAAACIIEALVVWSVTKKLCDAIAEVAREKSYRAAVDLVASGKAPATILEPLNQRLNEAAKQDAADNPFDSGLDRVTDLLKWVAIAGLGAVAVVAAYPVISELGHSAAAAIRGKREEHA